MACQLFQWLIAGEGPSTFQHALVGIGCLLLYDAVSRWRAHSRQFRMTNAGAHTAKQIRSTAANEQQRRAA